MVKMRFRNKWFNTRASKSFLVSWFLCVAFQDFQVFSFSKSYISGPDSSWITKLLDIGSIPIGMQLHTFMQLLWKMFMQSFPNRGWYPKLMVLDRFRFYDMYCCLKALEKLLYKNLLLALHIQCKCKLII